MNDVKCDNCKYSENCPVMWSHNNAACLTIRKEKPKEKR